MHGNSQVIKKRSLNGDVIKIVESRTGLKEKIKGETLLRSIKEGKMSLLEALFYWIHVFKETP